MLLLQSFVTHIGYEEKENKGVGIVYLAQWVPYEITAHRMKRRTRKYESKAFIELVVFSQSAAEHFPTVIGTYFVAFPARGDKVDLGKRKGNGVGG